MNVFRLELQGCNLGKFAMVSRRDCQPARDEQRAVLSSWFSTFVTDHPSDEDLSLGTPVSHKDGARKVCFFQERQANSPTETGGCSVPLSASCTRSLSARTRT
jgi:hypothetical protein